MLILLPPSEGKTAPARGKALAAGQLSFASLRHPRADVLDSLVSLCAGSDLAKAAAILGIGKTQAAEVVRNANLAGAPTARADRVYSGVLYEALGLGSLDPGAKRRASSRIAITSALFGLVRPGDRIPPYRLSGDVNLPGVGSVGRFWRRHLDEAVREAAGGGLVVDLRSSTYAAFWRPDRDLARRVVTLRVLHEVDGRRQVVSHFNKATKGRIVRSLLEDRASPATPRRFAARLEQLGWYVELGAPGSQGTPLDVVVAEL